MGGASRQAVFMSVSIRACMGDVAAMGGGVHVWGVCGIEMCCAEADV